MIYRLFVCLLIFITFLYLYVLKQNDVTRLRLSIPQLESEVDAIEEKNDLLFFNLQRQQEPAQLLQWLELPEFSHLKFPLKKDGIVIKEPRENIASED